MTGENAGCTIRITVPGPAAEKPGDFRKSELHRKREEQLSGECEACSRWESAKSVGFQPEFLLVQEEQRFDVVVANGG